MTPRYDDVVPALRASYNRGAAERDTMGRQQFKIDEREAFLDRLRAVEAKTLLELGAGTGQDSVFFQEGGLEVVAIDLSPEMVARCRAKGIEAYERDFLHMGFEPESFDAAYAMNSLLHVPNKDLPEVLHAIATVLKPGGLFFLGVYGGPSREGVFPQDKQVPKRFFAQRTDAEIFTYARQVFEIVDFHTVEDDTRHFQSLTLVRP